MQELYIARGVSPEHARLAISTLAAYPDVFVDLMMAQELNLSSPDAPPWHVCAASAAGFAVWGLGTGSLLVAAMHRFPWTLAHLHSAIEAGAWRLSALVAEPASRTDQWYGIVVAALTDSQPVPLLVLLFLFAAASHSVTRLRMFPPSPGWCWRWSPGALVVAVLCAVAAVVVVERVCTARIIAGHV
jgi:hypothetical protein